MALREGEAMARSGSGDGGSFNSSSSEFEFGTSRTGDDAEAEACCAADELFYNGKILPLELVPRMAAMGLQQEQEEETRRPRSRPIGELLRRGRSVGRDGAGDGGRGGREGGEPITRKSSSYPPCGAKSSSSIFRDLFGSSKMKQDHHQQPKQSGSKRLLKMMFTNWSSSSSQAHSSSSKKKAMPSQRRKASEFPLALDAPPIASSKSAPASPLSSYARPSMLGVGPVLHVPAYIGPFKNHHHHLQHQSLQQQQQQSAQASYHHRRKAIFAA